MLGHLVQVAVRKFTNQGRVIGNEVPWHTVDCVCNEVNGVAARTLVVNKAYTRCVQGTALAVRKIHTYGNGIEYAGKTQASQLDALWMYKPISAARQVDLWR